MSVTLDRSADGRIAVLRGIDTEPALRHVAQDLLGDCAFGDLLGLVIDLGGSQPSDGTADLLHDASRARLRQHQVITWAAGPAVPEAVRRVRRSLDRFDQHGTPGLTALLRDARCVFDAGLSIATSTVFRLFRGARTS